MTDTAALTVDVELFRHTPAVRGASGSPPPDAGIDGWRFLREAFEAHGARGTWFVVADLAEACPDRLRGLVAEGHEIGSHTTTHRLLGDLDAETRQQELAGSRERLADVSGGEVRGFRAPAFDTTTGHFRALGRAGYSYDSSVTAARSVPGWYGGEHDEQHPTPARTLDPGAPRRLTEVPVSVMPGVRLPLTGAWLRLFGLRYTLSGMWLLARRGLDPVLYVHPWELVDLPAVEGVPARVYVRTGAWMRRAVERILAQPFEFVPVRELLAGTAGTRRGRADEHD